MCNSFALFNLKMQSEHQNIISHGAIGEACFCVLQHVKTGNGIMKIAQSLSTFAVREVKIETSFCFSCTSTFEPILLRNASKFHPESLFLVLFYG